MGKAEAVLKRINRIEAQIAKKKALLVREKGKLLGKERRARVKRLINIGSLAEAAGILDADAGFLMGVLLKASEVSVESLEWRTLKNKGDTMLKEKTFK